MDLEKANLEKPIVGTLSINAASEVPPYDPNWTSWTRLFMPMSWDLELAHRTEPPEVDGHVAPYLERFLFYIVKRHILLKCFFVKKGDSYDRKERITGLIVMLLNVWWVTALLATTGDSPAYVNAIIVSILSVPFTILFELGSRAQCCGIEFGRVVTVPLALAHLTFAIVITIQSSMVALVAFFLGIAFSWFVVAPFGVALRVLIYGLGAEGKFCVKYHKWFGIGKSMKSMGDTAVSGTGLG